ncbi:hypothetical protein BKA64DRAFT_187057 [Cadophora sp. MPI-SDFR-AT-0126]|nr:hypothetical protein BKA64DRAFT_187057 [Leotiomycetes sp. MPI-SDFR-AT-0126]
MLYLLSSGTWLYQVLGSSTALHCTLHSVGMSSLLSTRRSTVPFLSHLLGTWTPDMHPRLHDQDMPFPFVGSAGDCRCWVHHTHSLTHSHSFRVWGPGKYCLVQPQAKLQPCRVESTIDKSVGKSIQKLKAKNSKPVLSLGQAVGVFRGRHGAMRRHSQQRDTTLLPYLNTFSTDFRSRSLRI